MPPHVGTSPSPILALRKHYWPGCTVTLSVRQRLQHCAIEMLDGEIVLLLSLIISSPMTNRPVVVSILA